MEKNLFIIQEIEADNKIFSFCSPSGQMLWPLIRNLLFDMLREHGQITKTPVISLRKKIFNKFKNLIQTLSNIDISILSAKHQADIVFFRHNFGARKLNNVMVDPTFFIASRYAHNSRVFFEGGITSFIKNCPYKSHDLQPYYRLLNFFSKLSLSRSHTMVSVAMTEYIATALYNITGERLSTNKRFQLQKIIKHYSQISKLYNLFFLFLWKRIRPKVIFYTVGYYGSDSMSIQAARQCNIATVEMQHGLIYSNHYAYNFHVNACRNADFARNYQDTIFLFGKWFENTINTPSSKYILGWPYHSLQSRGLENTHVKKKYVLFLPTGLSFSYFYELAQEFLERYPDKKVLLRPHTLDYSYADEVRSQKTDDRILIQYDGDLYGALAGAEFVVGDMSTAIFTAYECNIPVYTVLNDFTKNYLGEDNPFPLFTTLDELDYLLSKPYEKKHEFYSDSWEKNFDDFLSKKIGIDIKKIMTEDIYNKYIRS